MHIQVTTQIHVQSNTAPSTPALVADTLPENWVGQSLTEKTTTAMPTFVPHLEAAQLKASQRPRKHSRLSAFLHGFSVIGDESPPKPSRLPNMHRYSTQCYARTPCRVRTQHNSTVTGLRPANSTRGVIDPVHSPTSSVWHLTPQIQDERDSDGRVMTSDAYQSRGLMEMGYMQSEARPRQTKVRHGRKKDIPSPPLSKQPKTRKKIIGSLVFGTLLAIVLTTCALSHIRSSYYS